MHGLAYKPIKNKFIITEVSHLQTQASLMVTVTNGLYIQWIWIIFVIVLFVFHIYKIINKGLVLE